MFSTEAGSGALWLDALWCSICVGELAQITVSSVCPDGPFASTLKPGDVLLQVNGIALTGVALVEVWKFVEVESKKHDMIVLSVRRWGDHTFSVKRDYQPTADASPASLI